MKCQKYPPTERNRNVNPLLSHNKQQKSAKSSRELIFFFLESFKRLQEELK